jgi:hypothetical protein
VAVREHAIPLMEAGADHEVLDAVSELSRAFERGMAQ